MIARPAIYPWAVKGSHVCRAFWPTVPHLPHARQSPARYSMSRHIARCKVSERHHHQARQTGPRQVRLCRLGAARTSQLITTPATRRQHPEEDLNRTLNGVRSPYQGAAIRITTAYPEGSPGTVLGCLRIQQ